MPTQAHTRCADTAIARGERQEIVDAQGGILVVSRQFLESQRQQARIPRVV